MKKLFSLGLISLALVTTFTGCSKAKSTNQSADDSTPKFVNGKLTKEFHLKVPNFTGFNEFIIADKKGFFQEVGIVPEYTGVFPANGNLAQSVVKGDNDLFGSGHITTIAAARKAGAPIKIVLHSMIDDPAIDKMHMTWLVRDDGKINSVKDLEGKTIAMGSKGSCVELLTLEYLNQNGVAADKIKTVVMNDQQQEQALRQGNIDVAILHPPYNMKAENRGGLKILTTSYDIGQKAGDGRLSGLAVRAFSEDFIKKYPDVIKAYIVADLKAQKYINEHYEESLKIASEFLKIDINDMAGNVYPDQKWIKPEQIDFWIKLAEKNKLANFEIPGQVKATDLFTNDLNPYYTGELK